MMGIQMPRTRFSAFLLVSTALVLASGCGSDDDTDNNIPDAAIDAVAPPDDSGNGGSSEDADAPEDADTSGDVGSPFDDGGIIQLDFAGCTYASAADHTGSTEVTIDISGNSYSPACVRVASGTTVTFTASGTHPLHSMEENGYEWDDPISGATANVDRTMSSLGSYGFYCSTHGSDTSAGGTMTGVVYVDPS
jgi:plastocyanin